MSDEQPQETLGEQPANDAPEQVSGGEQPQDTSALEAEIENANPQELAKALGFTVDDSAPSPDEPQKPTEQNAPENTDEGEQPEEESEKEQAEQEQPKPTSRRRLSVSGIPDADRELNAAAIALVREGKAETLFEAMQSLTGWKPAQPEPQDGEDADDDEPNPKNEDSDTPGYSLADLRSQVATLRSERDQAIRDYDAEEQVRLTNEIEEMTLAVFRAEQAETEQAKQRSVEVGNYNEQYGEAVVEMETKYADLLDDDNSPFADLLEDKIEAAKARKDPELADPRHVIAMADQIASFLQMKREPSPVGDRPRRTIGGGVAPSHKSKPMLTEKQAEAYIEKATKEQLGEALWG